MLLPVWQDPSGIRVWTRNVAWLDIWRQMDAQDDQLLRFTILTPDLALERRLHPERIRNYDSSILALSAEQPVRSKLQFYLLVWNITLCQS